MTGQAPSSGTTTSILPIATAAFALGIFIADTIIHLDIAVPVLYVAVVLMAARFCRARGVLLVSMGCVGLTALSFVLSPPTGPEATGFINACLSISAIGLTTLIVLKSQSAEGALREQANLLDLTHDTVFSRSMNDAVTYWNRGAEELYGWARSEAVGKVTHQLLETSFPAPLDEVNAELLRTGRWEGELLHKKRDGTSVVVASRWSLVRDKQGRPAAILETNNDITERKRAEYLIAQVFERSPDMVSVIGRDCRYRRVNPAYERNWKMPAERFVGMHVADLLGMEAFEQTVKPNLDRCFAGKEVSYANWFAMTEYDRRYLAVTYSPLRPDSERVEAVLVITRDLTEHMLASESLQQAQADLARVNRVMLLGEMTASIAHEVNQPIAGAIANASACLRWLAGQPPDLEEARQALDRIVRDGKRAGEIIGRIRGIVRKVPPRRIRLDINEAILEVIAMTRSELQRSRVELRTGLSSDLPLVQADRVQLQQVILNLIVNAIEAMSGVGDRPRELAVGSGGSGSSDVFVEVRDSGPGLDPGSFGRLFDSFYTTKPDGMGMGLSISRSIVEAHGGRLWASANTPHGAVFRFTLPVEDDSSTGPVPSPS